MSKRTFVEICLIRIIEVVVERINFAVLISFGVLVILMSALAVYPHARPTDYCHYSESSSKYVEATVYFVDWDTLTRHSYSIDDVRTNADYVAKIDEANDLNCLSTLVAEKSLVSNLGYADINARLVIEAKDVIGQTKIFYSGRFKICSLETKLCRENSDDNRFNFSDFITQLSS